MKIFSFHSKLILRLMEVFYYLKLGWLHFSGRWFCFRYFPDWFVQDFSKITHEQVGGDSEMLSLRDQALEEWKLRKDRRNRHRI